MKFFQIAIDGGNPTGALFETRTAAQREVNFLRADDQRFADEAMREAGLETKMPTYQIHEVTRG